MAHQSPALSSSDRLGRRFSRWGPGSPADLSVAFSGSRAGLSSWSRQVGGGNRPDCGAMAVTSSSSAVASLTESSASTRGTLTASAG